MESNLREDENLIFSLDIGTRTIIGIVCEEDRDGKLEVLEYAVREHEQRNMYDGQIHDIEGVASVVRDLVRELESKLDRELRYVSVAAAGRALKTERVMVERVLDYNRNISKLDIEALEIEAVQEAQDRINESSKDGTRYYSIGYSIVDYFLDEGQIENLEGHKAERIGVEILATFLPKIVIEGLYSVIGRVGLEIVSITLEPIAAINVSIEKDLRILNLALVDIGAGTSDIAITKDGQIISYAMTQTAGDEITEALLKKFLLDFNSSENLKRDLHKEDEHTIKNILGIESNYKTSEILDSISETIDGIARNIAESIIEYNGDKPDAVFLIGGSSQMPTLRERIAANLGIDKERVSIRDLSTIENIIGLEELNRPDMITPVGIAAEGLLEKYRNFIDVNFNGEDMQIFNTDNIKVSDILVLADFNPRDLMPKWGEDFIYYRDGKKRIMKGNEGTRPEILVNGSLANLQTILSDGDKIEITTSVVQPFEPPRIYDLVSKSVPISRIRVNDKIVDENYLVKEGDRIDIIPEKSQDKSSDIDMKDKDKKNFKDDPHSGEEDRGSISLTVNGRDMFIDHGNDSFIFVDIFEYIDFDRTRVKGKLCLKINGQNADYLQELKDGDELEIYWEKDNLLPD